MKIYIYAAVFFTAVSLFTWIWEGRFEAGANSVKAEVAEKVAKAVAKARKDEQDKQGKVNDASQKQYDKINSINARLNADLDRLRKRPNRTSLSKESKLKCKGVTGEELSSEDSGFLTREAARADRLRTALEACYEYADAVASQ